MRRTLVHAAAFGIGALIMMFIAHVPAGQAWFYFGGALFGYLQAKYEPLTRLRRVRRYRRYLAREQAKRHEVGPYRVSDFTWVGSKLAPHEKDEVIERMNRGEMRSMRELADRPAPTRAPGNGQRVKR